MALTGISEFTFGFAFLHEQTSRHFAGLTSVPILPNLQQEAALGWDARLPRNGVDHYYQFKLADYLHRGNANLRRDGTFAGPYYRFSLHQSENNRQHNLLKWFSEDFPYTYYVAPEVSTWDEFNDAFLNGRVVQSSRLIPLAFCDYHNDADSHIVAYQHGIASWEERSEPKHHEFSYVGQNLERLWGEAREAQLPVNQEFAVNIWSKQKERAQNFFEEFGKRRRDLISDKLLEPPRSETLIGFLEKAGEISSTVFGAVLVILGPAEEGT